MIPRTEGREVSSSPFIWHWLWAQVLPSVPQGPRSPERLPSHPGETIIICLLPAPPIFSPSTEPTAKHSADPSSRPSFLLTPAFAKAVLLIWQSLWDPWSKLQSIILKWKKVDFRHTLEWGGSNNKPAGHLEGLRPETGSGSKKKKCLRKLKSENCDPRWRVGGIS